MSGRSGSLLGNKKAKEKKLGTLAHKEFLREIQQVKSENMGRFKKEQFENVDDLKREHKEYLKMRQKGGSGLMQLKPLSIFQQGQQERMSKLSMEQNERLRKTHQDILDRLRRDRIAREEREQIQKTLQRQQEQLNKLQKRQHERLLKMHQQQMGILAKKPFGRI